MNRAIAEITSDDTADYDGLNDKWADNEADFKNVFFGCGGNKFATVSYLVESEYADDIVYGAQDEERKININFYGSFKNIHKNLKENLCNGIMLAGSVEL